MNQIVLNHVSFQYPNGFLANEDINLVINQEEQVAIVGQNGAGIVAQLSRQKSKIFIMN